MRKGSHAKVQIGLRPVQRWKGERGRRPREDGVQSTEDGRVAKTVRRLMTKTGRGVAG